MPVFYVGKEAGKVRVDIAIIGAGPAGLSAAITAAVREKSVSVYSAGANYLQKAQQVDNYLGFYQVSGAQLMESYLTHAQKMGIIPQKGRVANLLCLENGFMLNVSGEIIESNAVIMTTGVSKAKEIRGEKEFLGNGVSYCATCDGMLYRGKRVAVWGLSNDAASEANFLHEIGVRVHFVGTKQRTEGLHSDIPVCYGAVNAVLGEKSVTSVQTDEEQIPCDGVFILRDSIAPSTLIDGLKTENGYIQVDRDMKTNIDGLFAAGDCTGKPLQIAKAVGEGLVAALSAVEYLDKKE